MKITKDCIESNAMKLIKEVTAESMADYNQLTKEDAIRDCAYIVGVNDLKERLIEALKS